MATLLRSAIKGFTCDARGGGTPEALSKASRAVATQNSECTNLSALVLPLLDRVHDARDLRALPESDLRQL
ncbi:hypothetical protein, partial [Methylobacterium oryzisoli]